MRTVSNLSRHRGTRSAALWERRSQIRKPALWVGKLTTPTGTHDCRVLDLSQNGAKIEVETALDMFDPVTLTLDLLGGFVGSVKWRWDTCIGIAIDERLLTTTRSRISLPQEAQLG